MVIGLHPDDGKFKLTTRGRKASDGDEGRSEDVVDTELFDIVIFATGFGLEKSLPEYEKKSLSYWYTARAHELYNLVNS